MGLILKEGDEVVLVDPVDCEPYYHRRGYPGKIGVVFEVDADMVRVRWSSDPIYGSGFHYYDKDPEARLMKRFGVKLYEEEEEWE